MARLALSAVVATAVAFGPAMTMAAGAPDVPAVPYMIAGDGIAAPLAGAAVGDAVRGRAIVANRQVGLCLLCHTGPIPEERFQGNLAPDLQGAGRRWSSAQLRLRMVDASHFNPATIMPSYYKTDGLNRVAAGFQGKTILSAQQIEDVVAWLQTLTGDAP
jgi:sulfur-oxidizing protein SoxX